MFDYFSSFATIARERIRELEQIEDGVHTDPRLHPPEPEHHNPFSCDCDACQRDRWVSRHERERT